MTRVGGITIAGLLAVLVRCLFEFILHRQSAIFRGFEDDTLSVQWAVIPCLLVWLITFLCFSFCLDDLPLIALLLIAFGSYLTAAASLQVSDAVALFGGVTLGRGVVTILNRTKQQRAIQIRAFLLALVLMLAFASCWHLEIPGNFYNGPRWMGLWNNPNDYGMLMGVGLLLAIGLLAGRKKTERRLQKSVAVIQFIAAGMMAVGLLFSYSRGAWLGAALGSFYLAKVCRMRAWRFLLLTMFVAALVIWSSWGTGDSASWRIKRLDLSRASVTHRLEAWRAGFQIMLDHPFGVGWDNTVEIYRKNYSPPSPNAELAITTNDYLMLGTQLGWPALICFLTYLILCFRPRPHPLPNPVEEGNISPMGEEVYQMGTGGVRCRSAEPDAQGNATLYRRSSCAGNCQSSDWLATACRAGAIVLIVGFWFDGGLFKLPTAATFWILLELGAATPPRTHAMKDSSATESHEGVS
jgi:hypothetical protein